MRTAARSQQRFSESVTQTRNAEVFLEVDEEENRKKMSPKSFY